MEKVQSTISQRIMSIIDEKGMSQSQLSKLIGVPQTTLNRQLSSSTTPKATIVSAVLKQFPEISPEWLLTGSGSRQRVANNTRAIRYRPIKIHNRYRLVKEGDSSPYIVGLDAHGKSLNFNFEEDENTLHYKSQIQSLKEIIESQKEQIEQLKKLIEAKEEIITLLKNK